MREVGRSCEEELGGVERCSKELGGVWEEELGGVVRMGSWEEELGGVEGSWEKLRGVEGRGNKKGNSGQPNRCMSRSPTVQYSQLAEPHN